MPVVSSTVEEDGALQADGRKYLRFDYVDQVGEHYNWGYGKYPGGSNAVTAKDSHIPVIDQWLLDSEKEFAWRYGIDGGDIDTFPWVHNTTAVIQTWWWRRIMNLMRDDSGDPEADKKVEYSISLSAPLGYMNKNNNATISGFIDDPAWGNNDVGSALNKINAVGINAGLLDHGEDELPL